VVERLVANEKVEGSNPFARSIKDMEKINKKNFKACDKNTVPFGESEIYKHLKRVDGWCLKSDNNKIYYLEKEFKFKNFIESLNFTNKVGSIAELEKHHPDIFFGWGYAKIKIFTHSVKGLVESDFILASKIDQI
jgi:4a-hydroxytetrahydrobiopterin dehydratase